MVVGLVARLGGLPRLGCAVAHTSRLSGEVVPVATTTAVRERLTVLRRGVEMPTSDGRTTRTYHRLQRTYP